MKKVIFIGWKNNDTSRRTPVFCNIEINKGELAIRGVEGPLKNGDCQGNAGQINPVQVNKYAKGWNEKLLNTFNEIWNSWHLNHLRAGCKHQRAERWEDKRIPVTELPHSKANRDENGIMAIWIYPTNHPTLPESGENEIHKDGLLGKKCTVCGYEYGTKWLREALPKTVRKFLNNLPPSEKIPQWV